MSYKVAKAWLKVENPTLDNIEGESRFSTFTEGFVIVDERDEVLLNLESGAFSFYPDKEYAKDIVEELNSEN